MPVLEIPTPEPAGVWEYLPFAFDRLDDGAVLLTNLVGEQLIVSADDFAEICRGVPATADLVRRLASVHIVRAPQDPLPIDLLAMKLRTRQRRLADSTALHIFVVTLRCEHSCRYCQVSRRPTPQSQFDMSRETALAGLRFAFRSPAPSVKFEFQGGEPLLNLPLIRFIVEQAEQLNAAAGKELAFVIATNLALLDDEVIAFCRDHGIYLSTSLDGPADLHDAARPRPGSDSWQRACAGIARVRDELGEHRVSALMTTSEAGLDRVEEIVDTYVDLGLRSIFLRPMSPYGFAVRRRSGSRYDVDRWLGFYARGLDHIIELNRRGAEIREIYAAIVAAKMFTNSDPGYVDLVSPAGMGLQAIVYNYDGTIYASDEGRMLAEMGDTTFRLGALADDAYEQVMTSDALLTPLTESISESAPMCSTCAYRPYCGADPVFHHTTQGDFLGNKPSSDFCRRNLGVFRILLDRYRSDPFARELFLRWAGPC